MQQLGIADDGDVHGPPSVDTQAIEQRRRLGLDRLHLGDEYRDQVVGLDDAQLTRLDRVGQATPPEVVPETLQRRELQSCQLLFGQ